MVLSVCCLFFFVVSVIRVLKVLMLCRGDFWIVRVRVEILLLRVFVDMIVDKNLCEDEVKMLVLYLVVFCFRSCFVFCFKVLIDLVNVLI